MSLGRQAAGTPVTRAFCQLRSTRPGRASPGDTWTPPETTDFRIGIGSSGPATIEARARPGQSSIPLGKTARVPNYMVKARAKMMTPNLPTTYSPPPADLDRSLNTHGHYLTIDSVAYT